MKRVLLQNRVLPLALALLAAGPVALARQDVNRPAASGQNRSPNRVTTVKCLVSSSRAELDINNVRAMVLNGGDMWWNLSDARYEVPKVTDPNAPRRHSIYAGAIWVGGEDLTGQLYVAAQTYRQASGTGPADAGFWPGPLDDTNPRTAPEGQISEQICNDWNSHAKIDRSVIENFRSLSFPLSSPDQIPQAIREWPGSRNPYLSREAISVTPLAPYEDVNKDGVYDPIKGDYPDIRGDQAIWWVINDKGNVKEPLTPGIGLEIATQAFAFKTNNLLNNMTFYKQRIANKSNKTLKNTYFGQWVDPDLGYFNDDYVGCDVGRGLGICYNGDNLDEGVNGYGANPPAVGVDFFEGPLADANDQIDNDRDSWTISGGFRPDSVDEPGEKIIMSNFVYYNNDASPNGNPTTAPHYYNYLRSKIKNGNSLKFGGDGLSTTGTTSDDYAFMFAGAACGGSQSDPFGYGYGNKYTDASKNVLAGNAGKGNNGRPPFLWAEDNTGASSPNTPADRRFLQSAGPFTLSPGAVNNITIGVVWASAGKGGAKGSLALLCYADDQAQAAFDSDFTVPEGPPAPNLSAAELDQQIVLSIQPDTVRQSGGRFFTTETYAFEDRGLPSGVRDRKYRFEGYLVYQLAKKDVQADALQDLNQARLIARGDLVNGVGQIINVEFDQTVNQLVPTVKVNDDGADKGIFHTLSITSDQFAEGNARLVNFKEYYFYVVPYAYNGDTVTDPIQGTRLVTKPYLEGRGTLIRVVPHKVLPANNGTILQAGVYDQVPITRIYGEGAGSHTLEILDADEQELVEKGAKQELNYEIAKSPLNVRIYDPRLVKNGEFRIKFSSRLTYYKSTIESGSTRTDLAVGDLIRSMGNYGRADSGQVGRDVFRIDNGALEQRQGIAVVRRIVSTEPAIDSKGRATERVTLDIEMLNDDRGGTFTAAVKRQQITDINVQNRDTTFTVIGYQNEPRKFKAVDGSFVAVADEFNLNDYWKWMANNDGTWRNVDRRASEVNEELIPEYGLSIQIRGGFNPGYQAKLNTQTQFLEASFRHTGKTWLTGVPYEPGNPATTRTGVPWLLPAKLPTQGLTTQAWDPNGTYSNILPGEQGLGGAWGAYVNSTQFNSFGPRYVVDPARRLYNLRNVDIVFTPDKSKWTRVVVLQLNRGSFTPSYAVTKRPSTTPSVDVNGQPTGENSPYTAGGTLTQPSTGMGWFPGYAIDLDRGVRLNMMFAESSDSLNGGQGPQKGADLIWEPNSTKQAGRNFVYVLDTKYDRGREMERLQDSIAARPAQEARLLYKPLYDRVMYVGYPKLIRGTQLFQDNSEVRVRIRVDRAFTSYPAADTTGAGPNFNPEYTFSLKGQAVLTNQKSEACKGLSLVRVVPNPYYAFSQYEQRQLDNIVRITNLPKRADITIYTLNGTLVRRLRKDDATSSYLEFNLKNDSGLPIASGVYLFHVSAPDLGCETVVKWFGIMRPLDLDTF